MGSCLARNRTSLPPVNPDFAPSYLLDCSSITSTLMRRREAEHITSSETHALGGFFFCCISQLRCVTDGKSAACPLHWLPGPQEAPETDGTKPCGGQNVSGITAQARAEGQSPPAHYCVLLGHWSPWHVSATDGRAHGFTAGICCSYRCWAHCCHVGQRWMRWCLQAQTVPPWDSHLPFWRTENEVTCHSHVERNRGRFCWMNPFFFSFW